MFKHMLRELDALNRNGIPVSLPADAEGYLDRVCPNDTCVFQFKVLCDDWQDKVKSDHAFCPMCRHSAPKNEWHTRDQNNFMQKNAKAHVARIFGRAMRADARSFNAAQQPGQLNRIKMSVTSPPALLVVPMRAAEPMRLKATCEECGCRYSYIGSAFFCPACAHNSAAHTFQQTLATVRAAVTVGAQLRAALGLDEAENTARLLREKGVSDIVTALQRVAERVWESLPGSSPPPRNIFQRLAEANQLWRKATGQDFLAFLSPDEFRRMQIFYQKRHLLAHCEGVVDNDYINKSGDTSLTVGQRIVVTEAALLEFAAIAEKLGMGILQVYKHPDPTPNAAPVPAAAQSAQRPTSPYSKDAESIARLLIERSKDGRQNDPIIAEDEVRAHTHLSDDDIAEAVHELDQDGLVFRHQTLGMGKISFHALSPEPALFEVFDPLFGIGNPLLDAREVARILIERENDGNVALLAEALGWSPRRMNPAISVLIGQGFVMASREIARPWVTRWVKAQPGLRRFAQGG